LGDLYLLAHRDFDTSHAIVTAMFDRLDPRVVNASRVARLPRTRNGPY